MTLKGIGEAKAEDIIRYREKSGGFKKIEDIMEISGIKEAGFQKIKDNITV
ncbi:MAG: ComEA family DNA-binding protein [Roseburia sp.]